MNAIQIEVTGMLQPDGSLLLDQKPDLPPGRVRVVIQRMPEPIGRNQLVRASAKDPGRTRSRWLSLHE